MKKNLILTSAVAGAAALALLSSPAMAQDAPKEKCAGIAKEGKGDCATKKHSCAGQNKRGDKDAWVYVPVGTCAKIAGGSVVK